MSRRQHHPSVWLNVRLDPELDSDLIAWLEGQPRGRRSQAVREALRAGIGVSHEETSRHAPAAPADRRR